MPDRMKDHSPKGRYKPQKPWWCEYVRFHRAYRTRVGWTLMWYPPWGGVVWVATLPVGSYPLPLTTPLLMELVITCLFNEGCPLSRVGLARWPRIPDHSARTTPTSPSG